MESNNSNICPKSLPMVSICCATYNHEKYIRKAIESFLAQKTSFPFEILIHDDASTDGTADIICYYQKRYPNIIRPIYQNENQYSKGKKILYEFLFPKARGKYIAICEGDDYWVDQNKLQLQYKHMEEKSNCTLCFHAAIEVTTNGSLIREIRQYQQEQYGQINDAILRGGGYCPTASLFFRREHVKKMPDFYLKAKTGDYPLQVFLASKGDIYYINKCMSAYRTGDPNSWTGRNANLNKEAELQLRIAEISMLDGFNKYTNYRYAHTVSERKLLYEVDILIINKQYKELRNKKYIPYMRKTKLQQRLKLYIIMFFPAFYIMYLKIKRQIKMKQVY